VIKFFGAAGRYLAAIPLEEVVSIGDGKKNENIVGSLSKVPKEIQEKMVEHFTRADKAYGEGVANSSPNCKNEAFASRRSA
jgi:hypothetical protein